MAVPGNTPGSDAKLSAPAAYLQEGPTTCNLKLATVSFYERPDKLEPNAARGTSLGGMTLG